MKQWLLIFLMIISPVAYGETLLNNSTPTLGPIKDDGPSLIKVKILDSFSGRSKWHGQLVQLLAENFWAHDDNANLKYSVKVSKADVMKVRSEFEYILLSIQVNAPRVEMENAVVISDFLMALEKAGEEGVKVVNYSVASYSDTPNQFEYKQIVATLKKYDMILVVPAGNEGLNVNRYPCSYNHPQIVCVGAGERSYVRLGPWKDGTVLDNYSNFNQQVKFVANGKFDTTFGTSFAAPRITQALAFLWSYSPNSSAQEIVTELQKFGRFVDNRELAQYVARKQSLTNPAQVVTPKYLAAQ